MSTYQNFSLPPERFLTVSGNVLFKALLEAQRVEAKRIFKDISGGKRAKLLTVQMDDDTELRFDLLLDHSEFRGGRLTFSSFRNSVANLLAAISQALKDEKNAKIPTFQQRGGRAMLFGVPGPTTDAGELNVMMLSANLAEPGCVQLKLQYMDPSQFKPVQREAG